MAYKITILTGAGISAASGIPTFRDNDGLWAAADPDEVASANAYARHPAKVLDFFNDRRRDMKGKKPNEGHLTIAALQARSDIECRVITQNIDNLHELAGTKDVLHIHGEIFKRTCADCGFIGSVYGDIEIDDECPQCARYGHLRPYVVLFGEAPIEFLKAEAWAADCDLFLSVGTSGTVYPVAGLVSIAKANGAKTVFVNPAPEKHHDFDEFYERFEDAITGNLR